LKIRLRWHKDHCPVPFRSHPIHSALQKAEKALLKFGLTGAVARPSEHRLCRLKRPGCIQKGLIRQRTISIVRNARNHWSVETLRWRGRQHEAMFHRNRPLSPLKFKRRDRHQAIWIGNAEEALKRARISSF